MSIVLEVVPPARPRDVTLGLARLVMPTAREVARARRRLHAKAVIIAVVATCSYVGLVIAPVGFMFRLGIAAGLVLAVVTVATSVMHDANHAAFVRSPRLNRVFGYTSDLLGTSSWMWRFKHNQLHHGNTNVVGVDSDIDQAPFARLAPEQRWRPWHRYQHIYLWFLYGFMALKSLLFADVLNLTRNRIGHQALARRPGWRDVAGVVAGKALHVTWAFAVPLVFHPWWGVVAFYLACSWLVGFLLAVIFQMAHCVEEAELTSPDAARRGDDFLAHQLRTTVNIRCRLPVVRHLVHWVMGGLDHQIEHHMAPRLPHTVYPLVAARLEAECRRRGITYRFHASVVSALRSHVRHLRAMGLRPTGA